MKASTYRLCLCCLSTYTLLKSSLLHRTSKLSKHNSVSFNVTINLAVPLNNNKVDVVFMRSYIHRYYMVLDLYHKVSKKNRIHYDNFCIKYYSHVDSCEQCKMLHKKKRRNNQLLYICDSSFFFFLHFTIIEKINVSCKLNNCINLR